MATIKEGYQPYEEPSYRKDDYPYVPEGWEGWCLKCKHWVVAEKHDANVSDYPDRYSWTRSYPVPEEQRPQFIREDKKRLERLRNWGSPYAMRCPKCGERVTASRPKDEEFSDTNPNWG